MNIGMRVVITQGPWQDAHGVVIDAPPRPLLKIVLDDGELVAVSSDAVEAE